MELHSVRCRQTGLLADATVTDGDSPHIPAGHFFTVYRFYDTGDSSFAIGSGHTKDCHFPAGSPAEQIAYSVELTRHILCLYINRVFDLLHLIGTNDGASAGTARFSGKPVPVALRSFKAKEQVSRFRLSRIYTNSFDLDVYKRQPQELPRISSSGLRIV